MDDYRHSFALFPLIYLAMFLIRQGAGDMVWLPGFAQQEAAGAGGRLWHLLPCRQLAPAAGKSAQENSRTLQLQGGLHSLLQPAVPPARRTGTAAPGSSVCHMGRAEVGMPCSCDMWPVYVPSKKSIAKKKR